MASPQLVVRRVVVSGDLTLDLSLDRGLNVLYAAPGHGDTRLTNKAGKTALVELIQYGLGRRQRSRETFHFEPIMHLLGSLWLEVELNGTIITIERSLQDIFARVVVREGPYLPESGQLPGEQIDLEALSSRLLKALGIPEVSVKTFEGELVPLTFPTLMRAFVLHQDDSFGGILDKVQPERRKTDVIGFLTRVIPARAFGFEERLADVQRRLQAVSTSRDAVRTYLQEHGVSLREGAYESAALRLEEARAALASAVAARHGAQTALQDTSRGEALSDTRFNGAGQTDRLRADLLSIKSQRTSTERELAGLLEEERRLGELVRVLRGDEQRVERLRTASVVLSSVDFDVCPRCMQEITADMRQREAYARCALCNRMLSTTSDDVPPAVPNTADIAAQLAEAELVLRGVVTEREEAAIRLGSLQEAEVETARTLDAESAAYVAPAVDHLLALSRDVAEREADVVEAATILRHAEALRDMQREIDKLAGQQASLQDDLEIARRRSRKRIGRLQRLYRDILRQVEFPNLESVRIMGRSLMPYINGSLYVHTGSAFTGLATVCYHLALLRLSLDANTYFPRMLVIDSPAVGDLNEENHRRLLDYLAMIQDGEWTGTGEEAHLQDWQIILTTRRMTSRLEPYEVMQIRSEPGQMLLRPPGREMRRMADR